MESQVPDAHGKPDGTWTFITNHAAALLLIAEDPRVRLTDVAGQLQVTERSAQRIVRDLVDGGYVQVSRQGRRNHYRLDRTAPLRHPAARGVQLGELLDILAPASPESG